MPRTPRITPPSPRLARTLAAALCAAALACGDASEEDEVALGRDAARQISEQLPILDDPVVTAYVDSLGTAIARRTARAELAWHFAVVNTEVVNAFALPGGYIFINRGLIDRAETMSELAGVLAHEVEHVVRRHSVEQMQKAQRARTGVSLVCSLTNICEGTAAQIGIQVGGSLLFARFGREAEQQADSGAFRNVIRAGIDPRGMRSFFEELAEEERKSGGSDPVSAWFADHPGTGDRVADIERLLALIPPGAGDRLRADDPGYRLVRERLAALPEPPPPPAARTPVP